MYVEESVYEAFLAALLNQVNDLTLAPAGGAGNLGPLVNENIFNNSVKQVSDAYDKGARILCGGEQQRGEGFDQGLLLSANTHR